MDATPNILEGYEGLKGRNRTEMTCTNCSKFFIAELDFDIDGNHIIECPWCRHEHCRVIVNGKITEERWSSRQQRVDVEPQYVWRNADGSFRTTTTSQFIRNSWLNRSDKT